MNSDKKTVDIFFILDRKMPTAAFFTMAETLKQFSLTWLQKPEFSAISEPSYLMKMDNAIYGHEVSMRRDAWAKRKAFQYAHAYPLFPCEK